MSDFESSSHQSPLSPPEHSLERLVGSSSASRIQEDTESIFVRMGALPRATPREIISLLCAVVLLDLALYGGGGAASFAAVFAGFSILFWLGFRTLRKPGVSAILTILILLLSARILWEGDPLGILLGGSLIALLAASLSGNTPYLSETGMGTMANLFSGIVVIPSYLRPLKKVKRPSESSLMSVVIPVAVLVVFSGLFVLANPVLREYLNHAYLTLLEFFELFPINLGRILFWIFAAWGFAGLVRGELFTGANKRFASKFEAFSEQVTAVSATPVYAFTAARNTLASVVCLFTAYLVFEISYIWMREIPEGFYYSGYAHEGAMWLTIALAFSTFTLGILFRNELLDHPKVTLLKNLSWCWSLQNLILAACVYYRLHIYIEYNGMTRMRVVGLYGILAVLLGFGLVVWKIFRRRTLISLIRLDLWALYLIIYLYFMTPVDVFVTRYNVNQILSGNLSPSVQITAHPIRPSGIPELLPLLESEDEIIRLGAKALMAQTFDDLTHRWLDEREGPWKFRQVSFNQTHSQLSEHQSLWEDMKDPESRRGAIQSMSAYTQQWYH